jgi:hypothetical protein
LFQGDVMDADAVENAMAGQEVVIGCYTASPVRLDGNCREEYYLSNAGSMAFTELFQRLKQPCPNQKTILKQAIV